MKFIITTIIVFISSAHPFISFAQIVNDLAEQKLTGKVKSLTEYSYKVKKVNGKQQDILNAKSIYNYNQLGNKTNEYTYNADGSIDTRSVFTYDNNGLLTQEDSYNPDGSTGFTNVYKYDKRGNMISVKLYDTYGSLFLRTSSEYDANDNETKEINYTQSVEKDKHKDVILNKTTWRYDEKGNMVEEEYYEGDSTITKETTYKYDDNGNKIVQNKSEGNMSLKSTYKYNSLGIPVEEIQFDANGVFAVKIIYAYDEKGNEIEESYYDKDNSLQNHTVFQISYDKNGNWVRKLELDNDRPTILFVREIAYY